MTGGLRTGVRMASNYVNERLVPEADGTTRKSFCDDLPKPYVKTTSEINKSVKVRTENISRSGEATDLKLLAVSAVRRSPLQRFL